ncbi:MAG: hypothetical protein Q9218_003941 [Villophora microphyllina]
MSRSLSLQKPTIASLQDQVYQLSDERNKAVAEVASLTTELRTMRQEHSALLTAYWEKEEQPSESNSANESEIQALKGQLEAANENARLCKVEADGLKDQLKESQAVHESEIQAARQDIEQHERERDWARSRYVYYCDGMNEARDLLDRLRIIVDRNKNEHHDDTLPAAEALVIDDPLEDRRAQGEATSSVSNLYEASIQGDTKAPSHHGEESPNIEDDFIADDGAAAADQTAPTSSRHSLSDRVHDMFGEAPVEAHSGSEPLDVESNQPSGSAQQGVADAPSRESPTLSFDSSGKLLRKLVPFDQGRDPLPELYSGLLGKRSRERGTRYAPVSQTFGPTVDEYIGRASPSPEAKPRGDFGAWSRNQGSSVEGGIQTSRPAEPMPSSDGAHGLMDLPPYKRKFQNTHPAATRTEISPATTGDLAPSASTPNPASPIMRPKDTPLSTTPKPAGLATTPDSATTPRFTSGEGNSSTYANKVAQTYSPRMSSAEVRKIFFEGRAKSDKVDKANAGTDTTPVTQKPVAKRNAWVEATRGSTEQKSTRTTTSSPPGTPMSQPKPSTGKKLEWADHDDSLAGDQGLEEMLQSMNLTTARTIDQKPAAPQTASGRPAPPPASAPGNPRVGPEIASPAPAPEAPPAPSTTAPPAPAPEAPPAPSTTAPPAPSTTAPPAPAPEAPPAPSTTAPPAPSTTAPPAPAPTAPPAPAPTAPLTSATPETPVASKQPAAPQGKKNKKGKKGKGK